MRQIQLAVLGAIALLSSGCASTSPKELSRTHPRGIMAASVDYRGRPHGISVSRNGAFCVSLIAANAVTCGHVTANIFDSSFTVNVGTLPAHVSVDPAGRFAYTANQGAATSSVIDLSMRRVAGTIPLGGAGFNVLAAATRVYVTTANGDVLIIDAATRGVLKTLRVGAAANGLALDNAGSTLYVSSRDAGTVTAVNVQTLALGRSYRVGNGAQRIALSPDRRTLYVAAEAVGAQMLDLETGEVTTITGVLPGAVGLALSPDGDQLYVTIPPANRIQIVDVATRTVVKSLLGLGSPRNVAFNADGATALVTDEYGSVLVIH